MTVRPVLQSAPDIRLAEAAERGEPLEVILVLRGRVRRAGDGGRWRMRAQGGRVVTFAGEWVVAATALPSRAEPSRGSTPRRRCP
jgi:hypothetical protein